MSNELSPVETLREIRARFAAIQATLEEAQEEDGKANAALEAARARIAELEAARRWVPVGKRLPDNGVRISAWMSNSYCVTASRFGEIWKNDAGQVVHNVIAWQPLPAGPEVDNAR